MTNVIRLLSVASVVAAGASFAREPFCRGYGAGYADGYCSRFKDKPCIRSDQRPVCPDAPPDSNRTYASGYEVGLADGKAAPDQTPARR